MLVMLHYFAKWMEVFVMHDQTPETVHATILVDQVFSRFSCCRELHGIPSL